MKIKYTFTKTQQFVQFDHKVARLELRTKAEIWQKRSSKSAITPPVQLTSIFGLNVQL